MTQRTMTYQKALDMGIVKEGDYFSVKYPDGRELLFRLVKRKERYVMWGPPTNGKIYLEGKKGYDKFLALADAKVLEEYSTGDVFEEVHALGLDKKDYEFHSNEEHYRIADEVKSLFNHPDDIRMDYAIASRCVGIYGTDAWFRVFYVYRGDVRAGWLYNSDGGTFSWSYAIRPEAIPKSTLLLKIGECDGSKEKPWICLSSQEENIKSDTAVSETMATVNKSELMSLIQGIREQLQELEEYAKSLK